MKRGQLSARRRPVWIISTYCCVFWLVVVVLGGDGNETLEIHKPQHNTHVALTNPLVSPPLPLLDLVPLAREHPGLVQLEAVVVGTQDPCLVRDQEEAGVEVVGRVGLGRQG